MKQRLVLQLATVFVELIHTCELMSSTVAENYDLQMTSTENETDEEFNRGASQPLGYQSRDLNVFKGVWI